LDRTYSQKYPIIFTSEIVDAIRFLLVHTFKMQPFYWIKRTEVNCQKLPTFPSTDLCFTCQKRLNAPFSLLPLLGISASSEKCSVKLKIMFLKKHFKESNIMLIFIHIVLYFTLLNC